MSTHTPGPWVWMSDDEPIDIRTWKPKGYYDNPVLVGANGVQIAGNNEHNTLSDNMIDNFMIAAAPELLEQLKLAHRMLLQTNWIHEDEAMNELLAVIRKAEGI